ncbi:MAG: hypothetical protein JSS35_06755 [Proteobacteria bacterium]|nr:hypothetical protein [Pseudomonadota bacterium]
MGSAVIRGLAAVAATMTTMTTMTMMAMAMAGCHGAPLKASGKAAGQPYLERMTTTGDGPEIGVVEMCVDPAATLRVVEEIKANRPALTPLAGCTHSTEKRPDGSRHSEIVCDRAKGAARSYRMVSDGVAGDMRMHSETHGFDPNTGAPKTTVRDTHMQRLGACPADLKPGDARMANGTIIRRAAIDRQREMVLLGRRQIDAATR